MTQQIQSSARFLRYKASSNVDEGVEEQSDRKMIFSIVRELVNAQFILADEELVNRLWKDVADRNLNKERIINLMYRCSFHNDDVAMLEADLSFLSTN